MRTMIFGTLIICLLLPLLAFPVCAELVTADDARSVAQNWVALTIRHQGDWGGSPTAQIGEIQEFMQGDRLIGYFCPVSPQGFLVIPLRRELAPVKAYSDTSNLDPDSDEGTAGLIKEQMAENIDTIEKEAGPVESVSSAAVTSLIEVNYLGSWDVLDTSSSAFETGIQRMEADSNYQQGGILLTSSWSQGYPYYNQCPAPVSGFCTNLHCAAGCGPVMAGQVMRYWSWPPYRDPDQPYNWPRMFNQSRSNGSRWVDEFGNPINQASMDAVARLLHEIGVEAGADYCGGDSGPCSTGTHFANYAGKDILDTFEDHFRYSTNADDRYRNDYSESEWFNLIKYQINANRPIPYRINGHDIVCDGWRELYVGDTLAKLYHMNYGWDNSRNTWWQVGTLYLGGTDYEAILESIYPAQALGNSISGTYSLQSFPYRYFDQDTDGNSATFSAGQYLQFLPGITASCRSGTGTAIRFEGTSSANTRLFTRGDPSQGLHIYAGTLKMYPGGSVRFL